MPEKKRTTSQTLQARNSPVVGWTFIVLGAALLVLNLLLLFAGAFTPMIVVAILLLIVGPLHLRRYHFELARYSDGRLALSGTGWVGRLDIGPTRPGERLLVDGGRIVFEAADSKRRRLPLFRWLTHSEDWGRAVRLIEGGEA